MALSPSTASPHQISKYSQGECHVFAVALHRLFGWQLEVIIDLEEVHWENPGNPDHVINAVVHVVAVDAQGIAWDIHGMRPLDELREELEQSAHLTIGEYGSTEVYDEADLQDWVGTGEITDDDGNVIDVDRPLSAYVEDDVIEAMAIARSVLAELHPKAGQA